MDEGKSNERGAPSDRRGAQHLDDVEAAASPPSTLMNAETTGSGPSARASAACVRRGRLPRPRAGGPARPGIRRLNEMAFYDPPCGPGGRAWVDRLPFWE